MPRSEITRFPHAVLEVKLSLPEGENAPDWVGDLIESGFLTEVRDWYSSCITLCPWREQLDSFSFPADIGCISKRFETAGSTLCMSATGARLDQVEACGHSLWLLRCGFAFICWGLWLPLLLLVLQL